MKKEHQQINNLLKVDPLGEAEKISGHSYKNDDATTMLGWAIQMQKATALESLLHSIGDTTFSNKLSGYLQIVTEFGFEIIYKAPFIIDGRNEEHHILWHNDLGILLNFDTFSWGKEEPSVNGGNFYYNWSPNGERDGLTSSGHFYSEKDALHLTLFDKALNPYYIPNYPVKPTWEGNLSWEQYKALVKPIENEQDALWDKASSEGYRTIWIGDHDCREAIITKIKSLFENGLFLTKWKECPFPWLTNYSDHKKDNSHYPFTSLYEKTKSIIKTFPMHIQEAIGEYNK